MIMDTQERVPPDPSAGALQVCGIGPSPDWETKGIGLTESVVTCFLCVSYGMFYQGLSKGQHTSIVIPNEVEESSSVSSITLRIVEDPSTSLGMTGLV
jgi:hypothetical protein